MNIEKYFKLPDCMTPEDLTNLFQELLDASIQVAPVDRIKVAEALNQLADRQWHTYTLLNEDIKTQVVAWIQTNWAKNSLEFTEFVTSIIAKLGLSECIPLLRNALQEKLSSAVHDEIAEALREYERDIDDPYSGLR